MDENKNEVYYQIDVRIHNGEYIAQDEVVEKKNLFNYLETILDQAEEISIVKNSRLKLSGGFHISENLYDDPSEI